MVQHTATSDASRDEEVIDLEPKSDDLLGDLGKLGPRGMARRDMLIALAGGPVALAAAVWGFRRLTAHGLAEMSETELQSAMSTTVKFSKKDGRLSYKPQLADGRKVASHNFDEKILGRRFSTIRLKDDEDRFANPTSANQIEDGEEVTFARVVKAQTSFDDPSCDTGSCGPGKPLFEEVEIMGETITVTREMMIQERVADAQDGYDYRIGLNIKGMRFICPIPASKLSKSLDRSKSQKVPLIFEGMLKGNIVALNEGNFEKEVLRSAEPVLVDFAASWCGPCKSMEPTISRLSAEFKGRVKFGKVDVEASPNLAAQYNPDGRIPHFAIFKNGRIVEEVRGADPQALYKTLAGI